MAPVKTGIAELDRILKGGIPEGSVVEISGTPGAGKTILGLSFASQENSVFVSFEQDAGDLIRQAGSVGIKTDKINFVYRDFESGSVGELESFLKDIGRLVKKSNSRRLVIDSISSLITTFLTPSLSREISDKNRLVVGSNTILPIFIESEPQTRAIVRAVIMFLKKTGCTCMLTSELPRESDYFSRDTISEFKADGIILLDVQDEEAEPKKTLRVVKMRYVDHIAEPYLFEVRKDGIKLSRLRRVRKLETFDGK